MSTSSHRARKRSLSPVARGSRQSKRQKTDDSSNFRTLNLDSILEKADLILQQTNNSSNSKASSSSTTKEQTSSSTQGLRSILRRKGERTRSGKRVRFTPDTKKEDGYTAKFFSRPEYLVRDGSFLRPKSAEVLQREKRVLRMLGAPESLAGMALPPGLLDEDENEWYEPEFPNDYEAFCQARKRLRDWIDVRERQKEETRLRARDVARQADEHVQSLIRDIRSKTRPTQSPLEGLKEGDGSGDDPDADTPDVVPEPSPAKPSVKSGLEKARGMLEKQGWKRGEGLGKNHTGVRGAIVPMGNFQGHVIAMDASFILRLQNMVGRGEADAELKRETTEECSKFGRVIDCVVHETKKNVPDEQAVSIFVKFESMEACAQAVDVFHGRFFGGRRVDASFFPEDRFNEKDLDP